MSKRTTYLRFGTLRQERGEKHIQVGDLVSAINVRQTDKAGVYQKRKAFAMTTFTFSGATWGSAAVSSCVTAKGLAASYMRDSQDRVWARDTSSNVWNYKGEQTRAWMSKKSVNPSLYSDPRIVHLEVGANIWAFAINTRATTASGYDLTIYNKSTGQVSSVTTEILAKIGTNGVCAMSAVFDGTDVWLFWVTGADTAVMSHKFSSAVASSTPTEATFYTAGGSMSVVSSCYSAAAGVTLVAFGGNSGGKARLYHSQLDTTNGQAKASPATGKVLDDSTGLPVLALGFHANQSTSSATIYYHYHGFQVGGSGSTYAGPTTVTVTISTLAHSIYKSSTALSSASTDGVVASGIAGVPISTLQNGEFVVWSRQNGASMLTVTENGASAGVTPRDFNFCSWWIASGIAKIGGYVYFFTGFDDVSWSAVPSGTALISVSTQRTYHLRRIACTDLAYNSGGIGAYISSYPQRIIGHVANGSASAQFGGASSTFKTVGGFATLSTPSASVDGNKIVATLGINIGSTNFVGIARIEGDTAKSWGKECSYSSKAYSPGSIPVCWSKDDIGHEISPLLSPSYINVSSAGTGSDFATAAAVYCIIDQDGTIYRSAPYVLASTIGHGATLQIPTMHHLLPSTTVYIEIYLGTDAKPKLQKTIANTYSAPDAYVSYTTPTAATMANGEVLYAVGNALTQTWPPQCQAVGSWRQRLFLADGNTVWASLEESALFGPLFNEVMRSTWTEGQTDINVMGAVDWNYFAVIGANGAGVIDGPGPDQLGSGNYVVKSLKTEAGVTIGSPVMSSESGLYFQDRNTGRLMCITQSLQVLECAGGAYDVSTETITAMSHNEQERSIQFHTNANHTIVIDYQHKTESAPFGLVYLWTPAVIAYAASVDTTGIFYLGSNGYMYRPTTTHRDINAAGTAVDYRMVIKTAQLQLADLQGDFDVSWLSVLGKFNAACSVKLTTFPDYATAGNATTPLAVSATPLQLSTRPPSCMRIQSLAIQVEETAGTGAAFDFEGFAVEWLPRGRMKHLNTSQVVT